MISQSEVPGISLRGGSPVPKGRVLVVEDAEIVRESLGPLLEGDGYDVAFAENGRDALRRLYTESLPDVILLDLRMPVMDGWEFRTIQKEDPRLGVIPVVAISADGSAQAAAISAHAYLRKPVDGKELLATLQRVLAEDKRQWSAHLDETERLTSLGRMAAGVGHEINNPLAFLMLNLVQSIEELRPIPPVPGASLLPVTSPEAELREIKARMASVASMLADCQVGGERIRETVSNLQRLSRPGIDDRCRLDVVALIEQSVSMAWTHIRHRARLIRNLGTVPPIQGNPAALGQVFLNLLINAAQAISEGDAEHNEIRISTSVESGEDHAEFLVVEVSDSGQGIAPEILPHLFEPFFTTKAVGQGTGLGLSISHQAVLDHGGRITVDSRLGRGAVFRVFLPVDAAADGAAEKA
ncbi:MAG TPA: ATP-binding protein [Polyangia bacterium]|nr:ATP-binding protein [Polyangia bacterium]